MDFSVHELKLRAFTSLRDQYLQNPFFLSLSAQSAKVNKRWTITLHNRFKIDERYHE